LSLRLEVPDMAPNWGFFSLPVNILKDFLCEAQSCQCYSIKGLSKPQNIGKPYS
jgi:hypothetical protein